MIDMNDKEQVKARLAELKKMNLPHMTIERLAEIHLDFRELIKEATDKEKEDIQEYLYEFYDHINDKPEKDLFTNLLPSLVWGIRHGIAIDTNTGLLWPQYHYFKINGKEKRIQISLQYHPDSYIIEEEDKNDN